MIFEISNKHFDIDEIAYFVPKQEKSYNKVWVEEVINGKWIERNFKEQTVNNTYYEVAKKVADHGGLVLEIGVGPGGGFMPAILNNKFDAHIIISDLSPTVVLEWKRFFDNGINPPNISYAALDNCDLPFKDNSIDIISAGGGFGNTEGDKFKALKEIYRVLKPNGLYISGDGFVTKEHLSGYEPQIQQVLLQKRPDIFEDYYDASVTVGFKSIDNKIYGGWSTKDDESAVADLARSLGIEIIFSGYLRYCVK